MVPEKVTEETADWMQRIAHVLVQTWMSGTQTAYLEHGSQL